jgi:imidazole glycerol-phosphate synthase subunit HisF
MLEPRVIPCLLLQGEALVKTARFANPVYVGDPVNVLSIFNDFEVDEIVLLDIAAARSRVQSPAGLLRHLAEECFIPLAYGGGIDDADDVARTLEIGYEKVVLNSAIHESPEMVTEAVSRFGSQAIVASVDVRSIDGHFRAFVRGGSIDTGVSVVDHARHCEAIGVGEILLTSIDREGSMSGFDIELVRSVSDAVGVPVIAHGGAGKRKDLPEPVKLGGSSAVAAGSLFVFQGPQRGVLINYPSRAQIRKLMT